MRAKATKYTPRLPILITMLGSTAPLPKGSRIEAKDRGRWKVIAIATGKRPKERRRSGARKGEG